MPSIINFAQAVLRCFGITALKTSTFREYLDFKKRYYEQERHTNFIKREYENVFKEHENALKHIEVLQCENRKLKEDASQWMMPWNTTLAKGWHAYLEKLVQSDVERLKKGLDELSIETLTFLFRKLSLIPRDEYTPFVRNNPPPLNRLTMTQWEKNVLDDKSQFKMEAVQAFNDRYGFNSGSEVAVFHNGLALLEESALGKIEGKAFIDGGAYVGDSAFIFADNYSPSKVYSFEPMPDTREKLATNIKKHNKTSVVELVPFGLSDRSKKTSMTDWGIGASAANVALGMAQEGDMVEGIELISIDDFVNENNLDVGVIKLDVEGLEYSAIKGALNTIKNQKPVLLIAVYHTVKDLLEIKPMLEELDLGYTFMLRHLAPYRHNFYEQDLGALATWEYMLIAH